VEKIALALLVFVPVTIAAEVLHATPITVFILAALAIVPLAKFIGDATDDLAAHTGPAVGGLMNATFGNATELIISLFALNAGLIEVVKASITGAIIGNLLLVLGTAMLVGGAKRERQQFNSTAAKVAGSQLLLAVIALLMPTVFFFTSSSPLGVVGLSDLVAILMILAYVAHIIFTLRTHRHLYQEEARISAPRWSKGRAIAVLFFSTIVVAVMSEILVGAIEPVVELYGWSQLFIGVVVVAIIGNIAEHFSAIVAATKDRMDLALQISIGSATQLVMFVAPVLVFASYFFVQPMTLVFSLFELAAIIFAVFVTNAVVEDGESNWLEGYQLLTAYFIIAVAFFFFT
jgi:Ca2+:H+ antiporter